MSRRLLIYALVLVFGYFLIVTIIEQKGLSAFFNALPMISAVLAIPGTITIHLWLKLFDLAGNEALSIKEFERFRFVIIKKHRFLIWTIRVYVLTALIFLLAYLQPETGSWVSPTVIAGGMFLTLSLYLFYIVLKELEELSEFKMDIEYRAKVGKARDKELEKMHTNRADFQSDDKLDSYNKISNF